MVKASDLVSAVFDVDYLAVSSRAERDADYIHAISQLPSVREHSAIRMNEAIQAMQVAQSVNPLKEALTNHRTNQIAALLAPLVKLTGDDLYGLAEAIFHVANLQPQIEDLQAEANKRKTLFILQPGYVTATDGDRHFIGETRLAKLYDLKHGEYIVAADAQEAANLSRLHGARILEPRVSGNYGRPT